LSRTIRLIGKGFNSPPGLKESQRRYFCLKENFDRKITDKTCCIHAEQRAIIDALKYNPEKNCRFKPVFYQIRYEKRNFLYKQTLLHNLQQNGLGHWN
jgi:hypothetical protein